MMKRPFLRKNGHFATVRNKSETAHEKHDLTEDMTNLEYFLMLSSYFSYQSVYMFGGMMTR